MKNKILFLVIGIFILFSLNFIFAEKISYNVVIWANNFTTIQQEINYGAENLFSFDFVKFTGFSARVLGSEKVEDYLEQYIDSGAKGEYNFEAEILNEDNSVLFSKNLGVDFYILSDPITEFNVTQLTILIDKIEGAKYLSINYNNISLTKVPILNDLNISPTTCSDSDNNQDALFTFGEVSYSNQNSFDYCSDNNILQEQYCGLGWRWDFWNMANVPLQETIGCEYGCAEGRCLTSQEIITPTNQTTNQTLDLPPNPNRPVNLR